MTMIKYSGKDIMPVVILSLDLVFRNLLYLIFKVVTKKDEAVFGQVFISLSFEKEMAGQVDSFRDKLTLSVKYCIIDIAKCRDTIARLCMAKHGKYKASYRLEQMATHLYCSLVIHDKSDHREEELFLYMSALNYFIYWLCKLIIYKKVDLALAFEQGTEAENMHVGFCEFRNYGCTEVDALIGLHDKIWKYSDQVYRLLQNDLK